METKKNNNNNFEGNFASENIEKKQKWRCGKDTKSTSTKVEEMSFPNL